MEKQTLKLENNSLEKYSITKQEALRVEGGPWTDRGTVTAPARDED